MTGLRLDYVDLLVLFLVSVGLPFLVDAVTQRLAATSTKTLTLLILQLVTGVVVGFGSAHSSGQAFDWPAAVQGLISSIIFGAATTLKLHNLGLIGADGLVAKVAPAGIGAVDPVKAAAAVVAEPEPEPHHDDTQIVPAAVIAAAEPPAT